MTPRTLAPESSWAPLTFQLCEPVSYRFCLSRFQLGFLSLEIERLIIKASDGFYRRDPSFIILFGGMTARR